MGLHRGPTQFQIYTHHHISWPDRLDYLGMRRIQGDWKTGTAFAQYDLHSHIPIIMYLWSLLPLLNDPEGTK